MENKLTLGNVFWVLLIPAFTVGMGNGSVFGAAVMSAIGRGPFESWGGWGLEAYDPTTFSGFIDWVMLIFGLAFAIILATALKKHGEIEMQRDNTGW